MYRSCGINTDDGLWWGFFWSLTVPGHQLLLFHRKEQREHFSKLHILCFKKEKTGLDHHKNVHFLYELPLQETKGNRFLGRNLNEWDRNSEVVHRGGKIGAAASAKTEEEIFCPRKQRGRLAEMKSYSKTVPEWWWWWWWGDWMQKSIEPWPV